MTLRNILFRIDKFRVPALDIGKITKVKVKHDGSGKSPSWYLNKVKNFRDLCIQIYLTFLKQW